MNRRSPHDLLRRFKSDADVARYGACALITNRSVAISRPFGARTILVDLTTENGTKIQWPQSWVTRRMR
jgi:hypothetical protein